MPNRRHSQRKLLPITGAFPKILTDYEEPRCSFLWWQRTHFKRNILGGKGLLSDFLAAFLLLWFSMSFDIVVTGSSRKGNLYAILSAFWPINRRPILMLDCLWYKHRSKLLFWLKKLQLKLVARAVNRFVVWSSHEVKDYATAFGIPEDKFTYIPYHHTLEGYEYELSRGDYIFSGGDGDRDYTSLLKAVQGLNVRVVICTRLNNWNGGLPVPAKTRAFSTTESDFRKWIAGSRIVVVPMRKGLLHSGGQQTYLNAMAMGKPVIAVDDKGARDYITHGVNGLIVPSGDVAALRTAIKSVMDDPRFAEKLGDNAKSAYYRYSTDRTIEKILLIAEETVRQARDRRFRC